LHSLLTLLSCTHDSYPYNVFADIAKTIMKQQEDEVVAPTHMVDPSVKAAMLSKYDHPSGSESE
jgi:hypothetical protein